MTGNFRIYSTEAQSTDHNLDREMTPIGILVGTCFASEDYFSMTNK